MNDDDEEPSQEFHSRPVLSELRSTLNGKIVLSAGGSSVTAEAREPNRRQRLYEQLKLARQLRTILEGAADEAEKLETLDERRSLLFRTAPHIGTLVALTEAVQNRHTLDDYHQYTRWAEQQRETREQEITKSKAVIRNQLFAMDHIRLNPEPPPPAARKEQNGDVPIRSSHQQGEKFPTQIVSINPRQPPEDGKKLSAVPVAAMPAEATTLPLVSASPPLEDSVMATSPRTIPTSMGEAEQAEMGSQSPHKRPSTADLQAAANRMKRRNITSRRCHDCKSTTIYFRRCHYWFLTGSKCGKTYCSKCLIGKYGEVSSEWNDDVFKEIPDWHCPSCTETCICPECIKERKKVQRRQDCGGSRRSSRTNPASQQQYYRG